MKAARFTMFNGTTAIGRGQVCAMTRAASTFVLLPLLIACSSSNPPAAVEDTGADVLDDAATDAADASDAAVDPVEAAVRAATWTKLAKAPSVGGGAKQDDLFFADANTGFVASGPGAALFRTKDAGATWSKVFEHPGTYFRALLFLDDKHGFAGNLGAGLTPSIDDKTPLYETKDGGDTWTAVTAITGPEAPGICNLTAVDGKTLFAVGRANGPANLLSSTDAGATWTSLDLSAEFSMLIDARFVSATEGWLAGQNAGTPASCTIKHTKDGGKTFDTVFTSKAKDSLCWKLSFPSAAVGYVSILESGGGPPAFGKTTDGGKTWVELPLPTTGSATDRYQGLSVGFLTETIGWMTSESGTKPNYRTFDGGKTWEVAEDLKGPINRFRFVDKKTAYAVGAAVYKLTLDLKGG